MNTEIIVISKEELRDLLREELKGVTINIIQEPHPEIINTDELSKRLDVSRPTIVRWKQRGKIPFLEVGGAVRFNYPDVLKAIEKVGDRYKYKM